jgi:uncharacterized membrane protein YbhN (UPF0104 family)
VALVISRRQDRPLFVIQTRRAFLVRAVAAALTLAVIVALIGVARRDGPAALAAWRSAHIRWGWIAVASGVALAGQFVFTLGWRRFLADCDVELSVWQSLRMYLASCLGRYLPAGKAWQMSIVGVMASEGGWPAATLAGTSLLQGTIGVVTGALLLMVTGAEAMGVSIAWLIVPMVGLAGVLAAPSILRLFPRVRRAAVEKWPAIDAITVRTMWALVWTAGVSWIAWGIGLYALAHGLLERPGTSLATYIAAWIGPFLAGLVAIVAPAGLGVRDTMMGVMLAAGGVSPGDRFVLVVVARVWGTILEVVPAVVVLAVRRRRQPNVA